MRSCVVRKSVRPLCAVLLVYEDRIVAQLVKYLRQGRALGNDRLGLNADLVARRVHGVLIRLALVGNGAEVAVLPDAKNLAAQAQLARRCVVQGVLFEGACGDQLEAELRKSIL